MLAATNRSASSPPKPPFEQKGYFPGSWPHATFDLSQGFYSCTFALSLLLVFRTNAAYDRWWEARKTWGSLVNRTRDFMRQALTFFPASESAEAGVLLRWTVALPRMLLWKLREQAVLEAELQGVLLPAEFSLLRECDHRCALALALMSEVVQRARGLDRGQRRCLDANLTALGDTVGVCERILRTPIPLSYSRHTSRWLLVWLAFLPFSLWRLYAWGSVPLSGLLAFLMLGIDEIGVQIEQPFQVLPLESLCCTVERNLRNLAAATPAVKRLASLAVEAQLALAESDATASFREPGKSLACSVFPPVSPRSSLIRSCLDRPQSLP
ncbi:bestrophin [Helicosporidium sp. ATCC 50920]|nr:bestrophin [Helicosporidium sp. ATCC 50920]|eukprot:KDD74270.1 bestrophin [Helicosporidium sp. ATCC 50920]